MGKGKGKKKKFLGGQSISANVFFTSQQQPTPDTGYSSDDEQEENRAWVAERDRQKAASREAVSRAQQTRVQRAVLFGEEHDYRANLSAIEAGTRTQLEDAISEELIGQKDIEFRIARREELEHAERAKKALFIQFATQEMLHRANIAEKETKKHISFFSGFTASMNKAKETEKARVAKKKLEADRKKAAERAKAFEERTRKASTEKSSLFQLVDAPAASELETKAPETSSWLSKWFSKS